MKERSYEGLVAGMRERPTIFDAEEVLRKDYKVRFPDRRAITLWNTPEISQFRGVQEEMDEEEERRYNAQVEKLEINRAGRENETATPEMDFLASELQRGRQSQDALREAMAGQNAAHQQQLRGMQEETQAQMSRLAAAQAEAAKRQGIAATALDGLRDAQLEHRTALGAIAEQMGKPQPVQIDNSVTNYSTTNNTAIDERSIHNIAMQAVNVGAAQVGAAMAQQQRSTEQGMAALLDYAKTHHQQQNLHLHITPTSGLPAYVGGGGPPPGAPGSGALVARQKRGASPAPVAMEVDAQGPPPAPPPPAPPAPLPTPAPTIPTAVPMYTPRQRAPRSKTPYARARPAPAPEAPVPKAIAPPPPQVESKPALAPAPLQPAATPTAPPPPKARERASHPYRFPGTTRPTPPAALAPKLPAPAPKLNAAAAASALGRDAKPAAPRPRSQSRGRIPEAAPPTKKMTIQKVAIDGDGDKSARLRKESAERIPVPKPRARSVSVAKKIEEEVIPVPARARSRSRKQSTEREVIPVLKPTLRARSRSRKEEEEVIPVPAARGRSRSKARLEEAEMIPVPKSRSVSRAPVGDEEERIPQFVAPKAKAKRNKKKTITRQDVRSAVKVAQAAPKRAARGRNRGPAAVMAS